VAGLRRAQSTLVERGAGKPTSSSLDSYGAQINEAGALAQDLAADLAKLVPRARKRWHPRSASKRGPWASARQHWRAHERLAQELDKGQVPGGDVAGSELGGIAGQMRQASKDLRQGAAVEERAVPKKRPSAWPSCASRWASVHWAAGARRASRSGFPSRRVPRPTRVARELMEAMREQTPEKYRDEVRRYYEELVR